MLYSWFRASKLPWKVRQDLAGSGLVENVSKSNWPPSQKITWLGFDLDLEVGQISIPQDKNCSLKVSIKEVKQIKTS